MALGHDCQPIQKIKGNIMRGVNKVILIGTMGADQRLEILIMAVQLPIFRLPPLSSGLTNKAVKSEKQLNGIGYQ